MSEAKFLAASILSIIFSLSTFVNAHFVEQFYASYEPQSGVLLVNFDVAYAMPDVRDVAEAPQPMREWLVAQTVERHLKLRIEAERYLRSYIEFETGGEVIDYNIEFPDFEVKPYDFPKLLNAGAYYNVKLIPVKAAKAKDILVRVSDGEFPNLLIAHEVAGEKVFDTIKPANLLELENFTKLAHLVEPNELENPSKDEASEVSFSSWSLLVLGFQHVIPDGLDHILFIVGMCLIAANIRQLLWQSLVFTLAHTLSMGLVVSRTVPIYSYGVSAYIEAIIALSIAFIAVESLVANRYLEWRYLVIGVFGFVHGLGFAGALGSTLQFLSADDWVMPLILANIGIEIAQALLVIGCFGFLFYLKSTRSVTLVRAFRVLISIGIACCGVVWFFQRLP